MQDKEKGEGDRGSKGEFGLGKEYEGIEKSRKEESSREAGKWRGGRKTTECGIEGEDGKKGKEKAAGDFMGIGSKKVVVADEKITGKGEKENEG